MARRGRPLKAGKRKYGRPVPAAMPFDKGTERAQAMRVFYSTDCCDALGRAYRAGLLGTGSEAKALLDTGRRIANAYWHAFSTGGYRCPLGGSNSGTIASIDHERAKRREDWLRQCLRTVETMGHRRPFDQLVIDINPDEGPAWLERLIVARRFCTAVDPFDRGTLERAIAALSTLARD